MEKAEKSETENILNSMQGWKKKNTSINVLDKNEYFDILNGSCGRKYEDGTLKAKNDWQIEKRREKRRNKRRY